MTTSFSTHSSTTEIDLTAKGTGKHIEVPSPSCVNICMEFPPQLDEAKTVTVDSFSARTEEVRRGAREERARKVR